VQITEDDVLQVKQRHPDAVVMAHPECSEPVKDLADAVLSTGQMIKFVQDSPAKRFVVATEVGMIHPLKKARPDAEFLPAGTRGICPNMKKITQEKVRASLENLQHQIEVPAEVRLRAAQSLQRMVEIRPGN